MFPKTLQHAANALLQCTAQPERWEKQDKNCRAANGAMQRSLGGGNAALRTDLLILHSRCSHAHTPALVYPYIDLCISSILVPAG